MFNKIRKRLNNYNLEILLLILLIGIFLRLFGIDNPIADWHSFRQADTASVAKMYTKSGIKLLDPRYHDISTIQSGEFNPQGYRLVEFPVYNALVALVYSSAQFIRLETWGRLLSTFFAVISSILIYWLGKNFIGKWGGVFGAFFYLFIPYNIYFTRVVLPEPFAVMLGLLGLVLFIKSEYGGNNLFKYSSALSFSLAILVKPFTVFYITPIVYLLLIKYKPKTIADYWNIIKKFLWFSVIVILPFILWRYWEGKHPEGIPFYKWIFNGDAIRFRPSFWRWIFGERLGYLILGTWGLIPFVFGLLRESKNQFIRYFLLGSLIYVCIIATANVRHDYYQTFIVPSVALVVAAGSVELLHKGWMARFVLGVSLLVMAMVGLTNVREFYKIDHPEIIDAGVAAKNLIPENSLVIAPYNGDTAFLYQTGMVGWPYVDRPIYEMIAEGAQYYISVNYDEQTNEFIKMFPTVHKTKEYIILKLN